MNPGRGTLKHTGQCPNREARDGGVNPPLQKQFMRMDAGVEVC
jgi:hypothetical protein